MSRSSIPSDFLPASYNSSAGTNFTGVTNSTGAYSSNKDDKTMTAIVAAVVMVFFAGFPCWLIFIKCCNSSSDISVHGDQSTQINSEQQRRRDLYRQRRARRQELIQKHLIVREWLSSDFDDAAPADDDIEKQATSTAATTHQRKHHTLHDDEAGTGDETSSSRSVPTGDSSDDDTHDDVHDHHQHHDRHDHDDFDTEHNTSLPDLESALSTPSSNQEIHNGRIAMSSHEAALRRIQSMARGNTTASDCRENEEENDDCDDDAPCCAICWSSFHSHDWICQSNNEACHHIFHKECMTAWLLKHEDCPICRQMFLIATPPPVANGALAIVDPVETATTNEVLDTNVEVAVVSPRVDDSHAIEEVQQPEDITQVHAIHLAVESPTSMAPSETMNTP